MLDSLPAPLEMRRPGLLMRAVRHGLATYRRGARFRQLAQGESLPEKALPHLIAAEAALEETRRRGDAGYSPATHVEVLLALVAELRLLARPRAV